MIVIYRKSDLKCVGSVPNSMTVQQEIEKNVLPNFGGSATGYATYETNMVNFHLENINGIITAVANQVEETPPQPTENELLWQTITDMQLELTVTNQALTDAQLEIAALKGV